MESQGLLLLFFSCRVLPVGDFFLAPHLVLLFTGLRYQCKLGFCALWLSGELSENNNVCEGLAHTGHFWSYCLMKDQWLFPDFPAERMDTPNVI